jgi:hypothetical protein
MTEPNDNTTHSNDIRNLNAQIKEISAKLLDLQDLMQTKFEASSAVNTERDRRYEQRFASAETAVAAALAAQQVAVAAALQAQKEATAAAFAASEKAIVKAELSQTNYNERSNEFRAALDDSNKSNISRNEADSRFKAVESKIEDMKEIRDRDNKEMRDSIANLRESRSEGVGSTGRGASDRVEYVQNRSQSNWIIGIAITLGIAVLGVLEFILRATGK